MKPQMLRRAFTLIELLIVVIIIGIIAAIALPRFQDVKKQAYIATVSADIRALITTMEVYFNNSGSYPGTVNCIAGSCSALPTYTPSTGVRAITKPGGSSTRGYYAATAHQKLDSTANANSGNRCINIGDTAASAPAGAGFSNSSGQGLMYACWGKY